MLHPRSAIRYLLVLVLTLALCSCGSDSDDNVTDPGDSTAEETIGAGGGTIAMNDVAELEIPAGSLAGNIEFTMAQNGSPAAAPDGQTMVGEALTIGPSGTTFSAPATITIDYSPDDLGGASESAIVIYTNNGSGWVPLDTTVDPAQDQASAQITHLSDFACMICGTPADGVFTVLTVARGIMDVAGPITTDFIHARFDTIVDPCNVVFPLHPDSVYCNDYRLGWDSNTSVYQYPDLTPDLEFIVLGEDYDFEVFGNDDVPDLTVSIPFPGTTPVVTNIDNNEGLPLDGFTVEWDGDESGTTVVLSLVPAGVGEALFVVETDNDGSHAITETDLADFTAGTYALVLIRENEAAINATGYDPNSYVVARVSNTTIVELGGGSSGGNIGPTGGVVIVGDSDGFITVPPGAVDQYVNITAVENPSATPAPAGWRMITPAFTISVDPEETVFDEPVELLFDYDEDDLMGATESGVTIFTDTGSGWTALTTELDMGLNDAWVDLTHFSDFVVMVEDTGAEGIYAELRLERSLTYFSEGKALLRGDEFYARFDAFVSEEPQTPLQPGGVTIADSVCVWDDGDERYEFIWTDFFTLGAVHGIVVAGGGGVPHFTATPTFVVDEPYVTNLDLYGNVSMGGFEVLWAGTGSGNVTLKLDQEEIHSVTVEVPNNGSYSFSGAQMTGFNSSFPVVLSLVNESRETITATGLDEASVTICKTFQNIPLLLVP